MKLGPYTGTDQDAVTYARHENDSLSKVRLLDYDAFNNRPYHFQARANDIFIVHFRAYRTSTLLLMSSPASTIYRTKYCYPKV